MSAWRAIGTAPKDGSQIVLTWMEDGKPQEIFPGMQWNHFISNPPFQAHKGIWAMHSKTGEVLFTWTESNEGAPTHWMPMEDYQP